jgi:hypothetical protein
LQATHLPKQRLREAAEAIRESGLPSGGPIDQQPRFDHLGQQLPASFQLIRLTSSATAFRAAPGGC